jgi:hypothetical protein
MKKLIIIVITIIMTVTINAQMSYFNQDPCMAELMKKGCTEQYETKEYADPTLTACCPDMKVRITLSKLVCNGKVVSMHIWSAGAHGTCRPAGTSCPVDNYASSLIAGLGLDHVLVSTGSVCKAKVSFEMPPFTSSFATEGPSGPTAPKVVNEPGGKFEFTLPCKAENCCFGYADVVDNKVVGVKPSDNPVSPDCPTPLNTGDIQAWFKQTFQVTGGGEKNMFNIVISPCEQDCDLGKLVGGSEGVWVKSIANKPAAGQKLNYNVSIESIKDVNLIFKSDIMPTHYQILDLNGRVVENRPIQSNIVDIKSLNKGIFFFKANYDNGISSVVKFIKD